MTRSPMEACLVAWSAISGQSLKKGDVVAILESMKMEHEVLAPTDGVLDALMFEPGDIIHAGEVLFTQKQGHTVSSAAPAAAITGALAHTEAEVVGVAALLPNSAYKPAPLPTPAEGQATRREEDISSVFQARADLQRVLDRHRLILDTNRPGSIDKRHKLGLRSARENVADLCDSDGFTEYGALAVAAQRTRRSLDELIQDTPADGLITGIGRLRGLRQQIAVMAYDPTVLAGTQGKRAHQKADRILSVVRQLEVPLVLFAEGGGGRPGDDDFPVVAGLNMTTFANFVRLNGQVPLVGIAAGRCFAGNASLLGCCDVVIATRGSNIGMGGPAMIEGGGLGVFRAEQIGPSTVQHGNGVIDVLVDNEAQAVEAARRYLSYFRGRHSDWTTGDAARLRDMVPENRLRAYDSRLIIEALADTDSVLELRTGFGKSIHTALARIEGHPVGLLASNTQHLGGAIDADAADKAARFMNLCSNFGLPIISLVDTPGFMVGPDIEEKAQVRHSSRMFIAAAHLKVPFLSVILRKAYGLGAMALTAGGFASPQLTVSWPSGEFGGMGLEGFVRLGYKKELEAVPEGPQREALFCQLVSERYEAGGAINMASTLEIDAVIDPAMTRQHLAGILDVQRQVRPTAGQKVLVDTW